MFCPRCGEEVEKGARYCSFCGATMPKAGEGPKKERRPLRQRLAGLIGRTRRERLVTAGTALAIAIAIGAFFALDSGEEDATSVALPPDHVVALDGACLTAKQQIATATQDAFRHGEGVGPYAVAVLRAIADFRSAVRSLPAAAGVTELDQALLAAEIDAGALARLAREEPDQVIDQAKALDADTAAVEAAIGELGLVQCSSLQLTLAPPP